MPNLYFNFIFSFFFVIQQAAISAEEWFAGKDANPVMMSLLDVFMAAQTGKDGSKGGSVLRQASRRLAAGGANADANKDGHGSTTQSASMSRLSVNMKPPSGSASGSNAPSHEPSPQPPGTAPSNGVSAPASYSVNHITLYFFMFLL